MRNRLEMLLRAKKSAAEAFEKGVESAYPVGAKIRWKVSRRAQNGIVLMHLYGERMRVRNERTDRAIDIAHTQIIDNDFSELTLAEVASHPLAS